MEKNNQERPHLRSSFKDLKGIEFPRIARTSSSFLALPVTKVTGRESTSPLGAAAIFPRFMSNTSYSKTAGY